MHELEQRVAVDLQIVVEDKGLLDPLIQAFLSIDWLYYVNYFFLGLNSPF